MTLSRFTHYKGCAVSPSAAIDILIGSFEIFLTLLQEFKRTSFRKIISGFGGKCRKKSAMQAHRLQFRHHRCTTESAVQNDDFRTFLLRQPMMSQPGMGSCVQ